jgi:hypothetical protein
MRPGGLPTVHGRQYFDARIPSEKVCAEAFNQVAQQHFVAFTVQTGFKDGRPTSFETMSGHNQLDWAPLQRTNAHFDASTAFYNNWGPDGAASLYKNGKLESVMDVDYAGDKARIYFRALRANGQTRYSPNSAVFKDKPEGRKPLAVLVLIAVDKPEPAK